MLVLKNGVTVICHDIGELTKGDKKFLQTVVSNWCAQNLQQIISKQVTKIGVGYLYEDCQSILVVLYN